MGSWLDNPWRRPWKQRQALSLSVWFGGFIFPWALWFSLCCAERLADIIVPAATLRMDVIMLVGVMVSSLGIAGSGHPIATKVLLLVLNAVAMVACILPFGLLIIIIFGLQAT